MSLQQQISDDLKASMKARDKARTGALRMLLASLKNAAVAEGKGPQGELSDDAVIKLVQTEVKRRREAAAAFRDGGREERPPPRRPRPRSTPPTCRPSSATTSLPRSSTRPSPRSAPPVRRTWARS